MEGALHEGNVAQGAGGQIVEHQHGGALLGKTVLERQDLAAIAQGILRQQPDFRQAVDHDPVGLLLLETGEDPLGHLAQFEVGETTQGRGGYARSINPPTKNRAKRTLHKQRDRIERMFVHLKINRAIATRFDQLANSFLGTVYVATAKYVLKFIPAA